MQESNTGAKLAEVKTAPSESSLDRCLVDGDSNGMSGGRRARRNAFGLSLVIEFTLLALLIIAPLMTSIAQPKFTNTDFLTNVFPGRHSPRVEQRHFNTIPRPATHFNGSPMFDLGRPTHVSVQQPVDVDRGGSGDEGLDFATPGPEISGLRGMELIPPPIAKPPLAIEKSEAKHTMRVNEGVEAAQLILRIEPRYPPLALQIKRDGTVILHAIISREGRITALDVLSGPPLLVGAALDAVRQWRYRPTLLNGEPVEVETTITVIFKLSQ